MREIEIFDKCQKGLVGLGGNIGDSGRSEERPQQQANNIIALELSRQIQ
jgi:hypothetical protein